jgi:hypothetical protein
MGPELRLPIGGDSSLAETLLLMRYVEIRSQLFRKRLVGATLRRGSVMPDVGAWTASRRRRTAR